MAKYYKAPFSKSKWINARYPVYMQQQKVDEATARKMAAKDYDDTIAKEDFDVGSEQNKGTIYGAENLAQYGIVDESQKRSTLENYLNQSKNIENLSEEELQGMIGSVGDYNSGNFAPNTKKVVSKEVFINSLLPEMKKWLVDKVRNYENGKSIPNEQITQSLGNVYDKAMAGMQPKDFAQVFADSMFNYGNTAYSSTDLEGLKIAGNQLANFPLSRMQQEYTTDEIIPNANYSDLLTNAQGLLSSKTGERLKNTDIESALNAMPGELQASTGEFMKGEEDRAFNELERQVPLVMQNLNARGMLFSGEREDSLTQRAMSLDSSLEQMQAELEAEDNQFYYDSAYRNALRKDLQSDTNYKSSIESERKRILTERGQKFQSYQSKLDSDLNEQFTKSNYERELALKRQELERAKREKSDAYNSNLIGKIAETGLNIGTNVAMRKIG